MNARCWLMIATRTCLAGLLLALTWIELTGEEQKPAKEKPKHTNRLAKETSPYLLQHAHNPVDWHAWGPEAFEKAKKEKKPIFLSIGYSSCYWCHVMERQCFESEEVAKLMNDWFVCIKVDREERPDVDQIYMTVLHVQGSSGGWPLSVFLTPDGKPIGGGTYWPPDDREVDGEKRPGFKSILKAVREDWDKDREKMEKYADAMADAVNNALILTNRRVLLVELDAKLVADAVANVKEEYDPVHGGFGSSERMFRGPKFPQPPMLELLIADYQRTKDEESLKIVTHTLDRMAMGGIYDHLGGGFHRYTVEREWKIPHFEKMLYDNAQLVSVYSRAYQIKKKPAYKRAIDETLAFIAREMTGPDGAFYSALDAETEGEEGKFYIWTAKEIDEALPKADAELLKKVYGVDAGPNFEQKYNILLLPRSMSETATALKIGEEELLARLKPIKAELFNVRAKRPKVFLDTKVLTGWNGLMIAGYAEAGMTLENPAYIAAAERGADALLKNVKTPDGRLLRTYSLQPGGKVEAKLNAYLEDYAYLVHGLLCLHDATGKKKWLDEAVALTDTMVKLFRDKDQGGFFFTSHDHEKLFAKAKGDHDGVTPMGNSIAALNLVRLAKKTGEANYSKEAEETFKGFTGTLKTRPGALTAMSRALLIWLDGKEVKVDPNKPNPVEVGPKKEDPVKITGAVMPEKPGADGKQTVTVTLDIAKGWHAYANPVGDESYTPTTIQVTAKTKLEDVKVDYPAGADFKDPGVDKTIRVYEGKTAIKVAIRRPIVDGKPDAGPFEVTVKYQVCNDKMCLPPKTVKLTVGE